jgi:hypothetical protein
MEEKYLIVNTVHSGMETHHIETKEPQKCCALCQELKLVPSTYQKGVLTAILLTLLPSFGCKGSRDVNCFQPYE